MQIHSFNRNAQTKVTETTNNKCDRKKRNQCKR